MRREIFYVFSAVVLLTVCSCGNKTADAVQDRPDSVACRTISVYSEQLDNKWYYVGEVKAGTSTGVSFSVPGLVRHVYVKESDRVEVGQMLADLDPRDMQTNYDIAKASLDRALDAQRRVKMMHDEQSIADIKFVEVETRVEQAKSAFAAAEKRLDDTKLYSPVSGVIGRRNIEPGENIALGISSFTILDISKVTVKISVPEREISKIAKGDHALIKVLALSDEVSYNVRVSEIGVMSDPLTHSYTVGFDIDNSDGLLREGMVCNVKMWPESTRGKTGYVVPVACVNVNTQSQHYLWVVRDGRATRQIVNVGTFSERGLEVTDGLHDGDKVVTEGVENLSEGAVVKEIRNSDVNIKRYFK